jgi:hypothetical protein
MTGMLPIGSTSMTPAGADGLLARAADAHRAVDLVADLEDGVEHRVARPQLHAVLVPVGGLSGLGIEAADLEQILRH